MADIQIPTASEPPRVDSHLHALKDGDTFLVADGAGDISGAGDGMFHNDTRVLSELRLTLGGASPSLLSSAISRDNVFFVAHLTNRPLPPLGGRSIREGVIHLERSRFLCNQRCYEHLEFVNYGDREAVLPLALHFGADFRDMFEVRGTPRSNRGAMLPSELGPQRLVFRYQGLDGVLRSTVISFSVPPEQLTLQQAQFQVSLPPNGRQEIFVNIDTDAMQRPPSRRDYRQAAAQARRFMRARSRGGARPWTSARLFNAWIRSRTPISRC